MDSINNVIVLAAGAAVVGGIVAFVFFSQGSNNVKTKDLPIIKSEPIQSISKPKKKKKATKKDKTKKDSLSSDKKSATGSSNQLNAYDDDDDEDDEDDEIVVAPPEPKASKPLKKDAKAPVVESKPPAVVKSVPPPKPEPVPQPAPPAAVTEVTESGDGKKKKAKETPEQKAARLERQKVAKETKGSSSKDVTPVKPVEPVIKDTSKDNGVNLASSFASAGGDDGWAVVEDKRKAKLAEKLASAPTPAVTTEVDSTQSKDTAVPAIELVKSSVGVDPKKVGVVIGPKGVTLHMLQDMFQVEITTPKENAGVAPPNIKKPTLSNILVSGQNGDNVAKAIKAISDLCTKGYSSVLEGDGFKEGHINVHSSYISDIIGKGGSIRKALQDHTGVRIMIPPNVSREYHAPPVKITLAGHHTKVNEAKNLIQELITYYHTSVTHPGLVHQDMDVPSSLYNVIIGTKGAEIRHIENNFKVSINIPNAHSVNQNVVIVGEPKNVTQAAAYIQKIMDKATQDKEAAVLAADAWAEHEKEANEHPEEDWMKQYLKGSNPKKTTILGDDLVEESSANVPSSSVDTPNFPPRFNAGTTTTTTSSSSAAVSHPVSSSSSSGVPRNSWASTVLSSADGW